MRQNWAVFKGSTPFRLSAAIAGLFTLVGLVSFVATYSVVRESTLDTLRQTVAQEMAGLRAVPTQQALISLVRSQSRSSAPEDRILSYVLPGGLQFGNAALIPAGEGFRILSFDDGAAVEGAFVALGEVVRGGVLTIAISAEPLQTIRKAFFAAFLFSFVPTVVLVVFGGMLIAKRSARRLEQIDGVLDRLRSGESDARVPLRDGASDDIAEIGRGINSMAEALEAQMDALRQVSTDIAHDLKTPIQRLSVKMEQIEEAVQEGEGAGRLVKEAQQETEQLGRIFAALLQLAQVEGGGPRARFVTVDLNAVIETVGDLYTATADASRHKLTIETPSEPIEVSGDRTLLGQALSNLMENALTHTPPGTEISLSVMRMSRNRAEITVRDTGPGIPENERKNVLRRLYRLERSRTSPGNGLGLSLVSAVVTLHGGDLEMGDASPGLLVRVTLPVV